MASSKILISREFCYIPATVLLALGAALMSYADFGVSAVIAPAFLLSQIFNVSFGTAEYCLQGALVLATCLIVRKFRWTYLLSFISAVLYGWILDGWLWGLSLTGAWSIPVRLICMLMGFFISSLGVAFFFKTYLAPGAYELFVKEIARRYSLNMNKFKIVYDLTSCAIAIVLALVAFGSIFDRGIGIGTVLVALLNGLSIAFFSKLLDKSFTFFDRFPWAKHFEGE